MKFKPIILTEQETFYAAMKYGPGEVDDMNDFHSYWTSKEDAEKMVEFLKHEFENACVLEFVCNQSCSDKKGWNIIIGLQDKIPNKLRRIFKKGYHHTYDWEERIKEKYKAEDLNSVETIKNIIYEFNLIADPVILYSGFPVSPTTQDFSIDSRVHRYIGKTESGKWCHVRRGEPNEERPIHVQASCEDILEAYEVAIEYAERILGFLDELEEPICGVCNEKVKLETYDYAVAAIEKETGDIEPPNDDQTIENYEFVFACDKDCKSKFIELNQDIY
jgi:hypothetical protein